MENKGKQCKKGNLSYSPGRFCGILSLMKIRKPKLWSAVVVTLIYLLCVAVIRASAGNTLTLYRTVPDAFEPGEPFVSEGTDEITVTSVSFRDHQLKISFRADRPTDCFVVTVPDTDSTLIERFVLEADENCLLTDANTENFGNCEWILPATALWLTALLGCFIHAFRRHLSYSIFSYNIPIYFGFAVFVAVILLRVLIICFRVIRDPSQMVVLSLRTSLASSGQLFAATSFPFLLIMTVGLLISNIALYRREGRSFTNSLGILMGLALTGGDLILMWIEGTIQGYVPTARIKMAVLNGFGALFLYFVCMWIGAAAAGIISARKKADDDCRYLIILGCGIRADGTVTPLLKGRCDKAIAYYFRQKEAGRSPKIIASGGQGADEVVSESEAMKHYLLSQGVSEDDIIMENKSETTFQNFHFSRRLMEDTEAKTAFFTTKYHVFRSGIWARRAGFNRTQIQSEGADTRWYFWPNAFIREFIGLLSSHVLKQVLICGGLVILEVALTLMFWM